MKRCWSILIIGIVFFFGGLGSANAADTDIQVYLNDNRYEMIITPIIQNGSVLIPLREVAELFDTAVQWNPNERAVIVETDKKSIKFIINQSKAWINGVEKNIRGTPVLINNRTMIPLRFVAEELGLQVSWDQNRQAVLLQTISNQSPPVKRYWIRIPGYQYHQIKLRYSKQELL